MGSIEQLFLELVALLSTIEDPIARELAIQGIIDALNAARKAKMN